MEMQQSSANADRNPPMLSDETLDKKSYSGKAVAATSRAVLTVFSSWVRRGFGSGALGVGVTEGIGISLCFW